MADEVLWPQRRPYTAEDTLERASLRSFLYLSTKRCFDLLIAIIALILLALPLLVIALLIALDSPGPPLFTQKRVGARPRYNGSTLAWQTRIFGCHKFRTMYHNCDQSAHEKFVIKFVAGQLDGSGGTKPSYKLASDPRVTRMGRWLRRTSLDELPQLINIIKGEMSLVGPRPVPVYEVSAYQSWHHERLKALPGLTGLWQVKGRSSVSFEEMVRLDIAYVRNESLWLDLKLIFATLPAIWHGRGAR